jgi:hypothetical protein
MLPRALTLFAEPYLPSKSAHIVFFSFGTNPLYKSAEIYRIEAVILFMYFNNSSVVFFFFKKKIIANCCVSAKDSF